MLPGLTTVYENGLCGGSSGILEGQGFSCVARALAHPFVVPALPVAGEESGNREWPIAAGLKLRPSGAGLMVEEDLCNCSSALELGIELRRSFAWLRMTSPSVA